MPQAFKAVPSCARFARLKEVPTQHRGVRPSTSLADLICSLADTQFVQHSFTKARRPLIQQTGAFSLPQMAIEYRAVKRAP